MKYTFTKMKQQLYIFQLISLLILFAACEEVGPAINLETETQVVEDTTTNEIKRVVLLEEFTGARCANCPAGAELAQQLAEESGNRVIIISIHSSGAFSLPYAGEMDFRTPEGDKIETFLGKASGYPSASINRKLFDGELTAIVTGPSWSNYINKELAETPAVNIELNASLESATIDVSCNLNFLKDISTDVKISVVVVEDDIISPQNVNSVKIDDYVHQHVFRTMLTPFDGELITTNVSSGDTIDKKFQLTQIPGAWKKDKLSVVAFVHGNGTDGVYQVTKTKL